MKITYESNSLPLSPLTMMFSRQKRALITFVSFSSRQSRVINPSAALVNGQLVCLPPVGFLKSIFVSVIT